MQDHCTTYTKVCFTCSHWHVALLGELLVLVFFKIWSPLSLMLLYKSSVSTNRKSWDQMETARTSPDTPSTRCTCPGRTSPSQVTIGEGVNTWLWRTALARREYVWVWWPRTPTGGRSDWAPRETKWTMLAERQGMADRVHVESWSSVNKQYTVRKLVKQHTR